MIIRVICKLVCFFTFLMCVNFVHAQGVLTIKGYAPKLKNGTAIYLTPSYPRRFSIDQYKETEIARQNPIGIVRNGMFKSTLRVRNGEIYSLSLTDKGFKSLCLAPGNLVIRIPDSNLKNIEIDGNKTTMEYESYRNQLENAKIYREYSKARTVWIESRALPDQADIKLKRHLLDSLEIVLNNFAARTTLDFIQQHPESFINSNLLHRLIDVIPEVQIKEYFNLLSKSVKNNKYGNDLEYTIDSLFIGGHAPVFVQSDTIGNLVGLESYKGKYVLIDFWASWCIPCRTDNPNLVKAMDKYKEKNFSILSVSLDSEKKPWLEAIKKDGLNWNHVSDLQDRFDNKVSIRYNVYSIPDNFLLDPEGKIIAKHLNGEALLSTLEKLIK
ncbi:TlpA disulfide reductase family protein [Pedobacter frigoris]|uniref:TlpA family protein disulfide reductase n=1 Tax=Pedobacter frigoris TaxID=2571272 RepID=UPI002931DB5F|nr:TlpA disulfide reductase family protein [Pedobacter frigoris]